MRFVVVVAMVLVSTAAAQTEPCHDILQMGLGYPNVFEGSITICEADVKTDPRWESFSPPPVSVEEAVQKTWAKLPLIQEAETRWQLNEVTLTKASEGRWIYRVDWMVEDDCTLDDERYKSISFAVTMSGKVIMPELTKRPW